MPSSRRILILPLSREVLFMVFFSQVISPTGVKSHEHQSNPLARVRPGNAEHTQAARMRARRQARLQAAREIDAAGATGRPCRRASELGGEYDSYGFARLDACLRGRLQA